MAALYDVHANLPALEAVLAEVGDADVVLFGGDVVCGAWPAETLELARSLGGRARFLLGNTDRFVLERDDGESQWVRERLGDEQRAFVGSWPATVALEVEGLGPTLFCHATPRSDTELVFPGWARSPWEEALAGAEEQVVVCGHTHVQYDVEAAGHRVVNPGSVGSPTVRLTASWALLGPEVELRTSDYDTAATAAAIRATGYPLPEVADRLLEPVSLEQMHELLDAYQA